MQWLAEVCVRRPVFATVLSLVILVIGAVSYKKLGVDQFPKIEFPYVMVITRLPGASPEDIERDVTEKIEGAVNTVSGIDELRSDSSEGVSRVMIQFLIEKDVAVASISLLPVSSFSVSGQGRLAPCANIAANALPASWLA